LSSDGERQPGSDEIIRRFYPSKGGVGAADISSHHPRRAVCRGALDARWKKSRRQRRRHVRTTRPAARLGELGVVELLDDRVVSLQR
jgi:hypothetical protein